MREPRGRLLEMSWDGFDANVRKEFNWLWRDAGRTLSDMTIFCEGGSLRAHKLILALSSSYFLNMILETHTSCGQSVISLRGVELEDLKILMEFMYKGKAQIEDSRVEKISELAKSLCIKGFGDASCSNGVEKKPLARNGSVESVFGDSDGEETNNNENRVYIRPEDITMDDVTPNRVTRASLNAGKSDSNTPGKQGRRLSESKPETSVKPLPPRTPLAVTTLTEKLQDKVNTADESAGKAAPSQVTSSSGPDRAAVVVTPVTSRKQQKVNEATPLIDNVINGNPCTNLSSPAIIGGKTNLSKAGAGHRCRNCDFVTTSAALLTAHLKSKHPHDVFASGEGVATADGAPETRKSVTPEGAHKSTILNVSTESPEEINASNLGCDKSSNEVASNGERFSCADCGFIAGNAGALGSHRNRHKVASSNNVSPPSATAAVTSAAASPATGGSPSKCSMSLTRSKSRTSDANSRSGSSSSPPPSVPSVNDLLSADHCKMIFDCPKCESISFKTPAIMTRHILKRHSGEKVQPVTRIKCGHCEHFYETMIAQSSSSPNHLLINHLVTLHKIDLSGLMFKAQFTPIVVKQEPEEEVGELVKIQDTTGAQRMENGISGNDSQMETASNADTERASSRGSFIMTPSGAIKRNRLSHDEDATVIDADIKVKKEPDLGGDALPTAFHKCDLCNYQTSMEHFMKRHKIACHSNGKTEDPFVCKYCNFSTANRSTIKSHLVKAHKDSTTKVRECFRNIEQIKKLTRSRTENGKQLVKKMTRKSFPGADPLTKGTVHCQSTFAEKRRSDIVKKKNRVKISSAGRSMQPSTPADHSRPSTSSGDEARMLNKPNKKTNLNAAMKLKKAALAKQRRKTDPGCRIKTTVTKSVPSSKSSSNLKRISSRLSTGTVTPVPPTDGSSVGEGGCSRRGVLVSKYALKDLKCPDCTYVARSMLMFEKHISLHQIYGENKLALCELCGVVKLKGSMPYHMKKHEQESVTQTTPP